MPSESVWIMMSYKNCRTNISVTARCLGGHFINNENSYYCMHPARRDFYDAEEACKNPISNEEILNPFVKEQTLHFVKVDFLVTWFPSISKIH